MAFGAAANDGGTAVLSSPSGDPVPGSLVLPPQFSRRIFLVSFVMPVCALYALSLALYVLFCLALLVFANSINYWRHPVYGSWRRTLDMVCVAGVGVYTFVLSLTAVAWSPEVGCYHALLLCGALCYANARLAGADKDTGSKWHVAMHLYANAASIVLYHFLGAAASQSAASAAARARAP